MSYKVFLSHSSRDQGLIISLSNLLERLGVQVFVAEWYLSPGQNLSDEVFDQIQKADCVVALLTRLGIRSNWVQQELGYALKTTKPIIPLVERGIDQETLGVLQGKEVIYYDPQQPQESLNHLVTYVNSLKLSKEKDGAYLVTAGLILLLLLLAGKQK